MFDKLTLIEQRFNEVSVRLMQPEVVSDQEQYRKLMKEHKNLSPIVDKFSELQRVTSQYEDAEAMLADSSLDAELREMAEEEIAETKPQIEALTDELKIMLLPRDPNDDKNVIVEIRCGTGGEESALFVNSVMRMYFMFAEAKGFKTEVISASETELGGYKEVSFLIEGDGAYSCMKYESGVHRVQRVPETESSGRIHTSAITVAVLPEVDEVEMEINPADLKIDTFRSSGAGGQHINKTESAIRITHIPSGMVVECQDERSQHKNKDKAMKVLRSRLYEQAQAEQTDKIAEERKSQVGSGDRSERIRTYNYPQGRVTDHRIGLTLYRLEQILNGDLHEIVEALLTAERTAKLSSGEVSQ